MKALTLLLLLSFSSARACEDYDAKGNDMSIKCFKQNPNLKFPDFDNPLASMSGFPVADEKGDVEKAWNEKIPDDFHRTGGSMLYGWIKMCRDDRDPEGIFRGEYVDKEKRYTGKFRYVHPEGKPIPEDLFSAYSLSNFASSSVDVRPLNRDRRPINYFYLEPVNPEDIERWVYEE